MSSVNIENQILTAIETVVNNAVNKAGYDKTIKAKIVKCTNSSLGEYKVRYQDSTFLAYSTDTEINYMENSLVYVLIPGNDMSQIKTILGAVERDNVEYNTILEQEDYYNIIGDNTISTSNVYELCSYDGNTEIVLYDRDNDINLISYDETAMQTYLTNADSFMCGAWFKTDLNEEQMRKGNYGIAFDIDFSDEIDGSIITKTFLIDVNNMEGNPYYFKNFIRQVEILDIKISNYESVKNIKIFAKDFPKQEIGHEADIFIKTPILYAVSALTEEELNGYALVLNANKLYFNEEDSEDATITLEGILKVKNKEIANQNFEYYWFKEDMAINIDSDGYSTYGGMGWKCLNNYNILDSETNEIAYITSNNILTIKKEDNLSARNTYKLVVVFEDGSSVEKQIIIKNYDYEYQLEILSDEGTEFYFDNGTPSLTLTINGIESDNPNYSYQWAKIDNNEQCTILEETIDYNTEYNNAVIGYNTLQAQIESGEIMPVAAQEQLEAYLTIIEKYNTIERVEGNKIFKIQVKDIITYTTYKCSVYDEGILIGTASIILNNNSEVNGEYTLNIVNGNKTFNYTNAGIAPTSQSLENPVELEPLTFTIIDNNGNYLPQMILENCEIQWTIPNNKTFLVGTGGNSLYQIYGLKEKYDITNLDNNIIQLDVRYKGLSLHAISGFTFVKDGDPGTNGTDIVCKIVPNIEGTLETYPMLVNGVINYTPVDSDKWFKAQLWKDGEKIYEGTNANSSLKVTNVKWSNLINKYSISKSDRSFINITANGICSYHDITLAENEYSADIIKVQITYNDSIYYSTLPIIKVEYENGYTINLLKNTGFRYAIYTSDGRNPSYDNTDPFNLKVTQEIDGYIEDISNVSNEYQLNYDWSIQGSIYNNNIWEENINLVQKNINNNLAKYAPIDSYDGQCVSNAINCLISQNGNIIGNIHIPIHLYLNRYGIASINDWDGNSINIKDDEGIILSPQVGAGYKNNSNQFTGLLMGKVKENTTSNIETGLFGYYNGERTIFLDAETGTAKFGKTGSGQIILDPTNNIAKIQSGNYSSSAGLLIDFTTPEIKYGNGAFIVDRNGKVTGTNVYINGGALNIGSKFSVDENGYLRATGATVSGTIRANDGYIGGWYIEDDILYSGEGDSYVCLSAEDYDDNHYAFWTGGETASSAPLRITKKGQLVAEKIKVTGGTLNINDNFKVSSDGVLTATGAVISGKITASSGNIGGWKINSSSLSSSDPGVTNYIRSNGNVIFAGDYGMIKFDTSIVRITTANKMLLSDKYDASSLPSSNDTMAIRAYSGTVHINSNYGVYAGSNRLDSSSSIKIKENIAPMTDEYLNEICSTIKQIPFYTYDYKEGYGFKNEFGFIIEDIENTCLKDLLKIEQSEDSELIKYYSTTNLTKLNLILIQNLMKKIDKLEQEIKGE